MTDLRKTITAVAVVLVPAGLDARAQVIPVTNPGFEVPNLGGGAFGFVYRPTDPGVGWTFGLGAGIAANSSAFTSGNPPAPDGGQVGFLQNTAATISQSVTVLTEGTYAVNFFAAQRGAGGFTQPSVQDFAVDFDGIVVGAFQPAGTAYTQYATAPIRLTAASHTLTFISLNSAGAFDVTAFVDSIRISPIPEPTSLMLASTGVLGLLASYGGRRRSGGLSGA